MKRFFVCTFFVFSVCISARAQNPVENDTIKSDTIAHSKFNYKALLFPAALIGYGVIGIESDQLKSYNTAIREEVTEDIDKKITIDDFSQYAPAASVYALNALGVKGKHNFRDGSVILATSYLMLSATVLSLKSVTRIERPDGTSKNAFPSGHTATAFAGAEFMRQEYADASIWYGIAGYAVATGTGLFRVYNNRHWLTDVVAGAGVGILSTKIAYWVNPYLTNALFGKKESKSTTLLCPSYDGQKFGLGIVRTF